MADLDFTKFTSKFAMRVFGLEGEAVSAQSAIKGIEVRCGVGRANQSPARTIPLNG